LFNANDTAPYGLDGRAADNAVVERFDDTFAFGSDSGAKRDLVAYREAVSHNRAPFDTLNRVFDRREFESFAADHQTSIADREPVIVALAVATGRHKWRGRHSRWWPRNHARSTCRRPRPPGPPSSPSSRLWPPGLPNSRLSQTLCNR
jgi:hypothetical protein